MKNLTKSECKVIKMDFFISKEQFNQYLNVQRLGFFNMLSEQARGMTDLSKEEYKYIIKNYTYLEKMYVNN